MDKHEAAEAKATKKAPEPEREGAECAAWGRVRSAAMQRPGCYSPVQREKVGARWDLFGGDGMVDDMRLQRVSKAVIGTETSVGTKMEACLAVSPN